MLIIRISQVIYSTLFLLKTDYIVLNKHRSIMISDNHHDITPLVIIVSSKNCK